MKTSYDSEDAGALNQVYAASFLPFGGTIDAVDLVAQAMRETGLTDLGGDKLAEAGFRSRLTAMCASLEGEANLTAIGRTRAHGRLLAMLISRLRTVDYGKQAGDLGAISAPLVGTGMPRAGTSFLQALLAQDPDNLVPRTGEAMVPVPPKGVLVDEAARLDLVQRMITVQGLDAPEINAIHPFAPDAEDEDVLFQEAACGTLYQAFFNVPGFIAKANENLDELYAWQKQLMRIAQHGQSARRWVLKAPEYIGNLDLVRGQYPDAMIFVNHRDPAKVIASIASLFVTFQSINSPGSIPPEYLGPAMLQGQAQSFRAFEEWRAANPTVKVIDVHYKQLVADPVAEAERLYEAFGISMSATARQCMSDFLLVNRHGQASHGVRHSYTLAEFGLTEAMVDEVLGDYIDSYGIERERR